MKFNIVRAVVIGFLLSTSLMSMVYSSEGPSIKRKSVFEEVRHQYKTKEFLNYNFKSTISVSLGTVGLLLAGLNYRYGNDFTNTTLINSGLTAISTIAGLVGGINLYRACNRDYVNNFRIGQDKDLRAVTKKTRTSCRKIFL